MFIVMFCQLRHEVNSAEGSADLHVHFTLAQYIPVYKHSHQRIRFGSRLPQDRVAFVSVLSLCGFRFSVVRLRPREG